MGNILILCLLFLLTTLGVAFGRAVFRQKVELEYKNLYLQRIADGKLDYGEVRELIARLPKALDREMTLGAMCYEMITITGIASLDSKPVFFICEKCGSRTAYPFDDAHIYQIQDFEHINKYRLILKKVKGIRIRVDSRQFCRKCSPNVKEPKLELVVEWPSEKKIHRTTDFNEDDLQHLVEFSQGRAVYTERDGEYLFADISDRLQQLLGIEGDKTATGNQSK